MVVSVSAWVCTCLACSVYTCVCVRSEILAWCLSLSKDNWAGPVRHIGLVNLHVPR